MKLVGWPWGSGTNIGVKIVAVVVAFMIWYSVAGQNQEKRNFFASLRFVNLPDSLTLTGAVPQEAELSLSGSHRELLFMRFKKLTVMVNMARARPGRFSQRLSVSDVILPRNVEPGDVRILSPSTVDVGIARLVSKRLRVAVMLSGSLGQDLLLDEVPSAQPAVVVATGPQSAVEPLTKLQTRAIDLGKIRESVEREVALDYDRDLLTCVPADVVVAISVSARGRRVLANVPPTVLIDEGELVIEVFPKTVSLTIEGSQSMLDTLSSGDVSVLVDLSGKPPGRYTLAPEVIVPDGVEKYFMDIDTLTIFVSQPPDTQSVSSQK